jgi:hypothetical protein
MPNHAQDGYSELKAGVPARHIEKCYGGDCDFVFDHAAVVTAFEKFVRAPSTKARFPPSSISTGSYLLRASGAAALSNCAVVLID